jgi:hypothetical protein
MKNSDNEKVFLDVFDIEINKLIDDSFLNLDNMKKIFDQSHNRIVNF